MSDKQAKTDATPAPAKALGGMKGKLIIGGFMGSVVIVECLLAYFLIPTADQVAALAEHNLQKKLPTSLIDGHDEHHEDAAKSEEIDLGEYSITITQPNSPTAIRVDFHLVGTVLTEERKDVQAAFDDHVHRFRDMVISEIRHLENADLADPGLGLIKRRILEKSNTLFGKPILKSVVFPDFSYIEQ